MSQAVRKVLKRALQSMLKPLVRILLRNGVPCAAFQELVRHAYVRVAWEEFGVEGRKQSVSRTATITGLTRKEVRRILDEPEDIELDHDKYNRATRVLTGWLRDKSFHGPDGKPKALLFEGEKNCFTDLVRTYSGDVTARAILDELSRGGAVKKLKDGRIKPMARGYIPSVDDHVKITILGRDTTDLISTIDHNLTSAPEEAFYQRKVAYDNLVVESLPKIREFSRKEAQKLLEKIDRLMAKHDVDANSKLSGEGKARSLLGIYYYEEALEEE